MASGINSPFCSEDKTATGDAELQDAKSKVTPFIGNLSKYIPLPSGHAGPPSRGYLQFDACFEGGDQYVLIVSLLLCSKLMSYQQFTAGNLGRADYISDYEYDLFIRPDTGNPRYPIPLMLACLTIIHIIDAM